MKGYERGIQAIRHGTVGKGLANSAYTCYKAQLPDCSALGCGNQTRWRRGVANLKLQVFMLLLELQRGSSEAFAPVPSRHIIYQTQFYVISPAEILRSNNLLKEGEIQEDNSPTSTRPCSTRPGKQQKQSLTTVRMSWQLIKYISTNRIILFVGPNANISPDVLNKTMLTYPSSTPNSAKLTTP